MRKESSFKEYSPTEQVTFQKQMCILRTRRWPQWPIGALDFYSTGRVEQLSYILCAKGVG